MTDSDVAAELLLRDTVEVTLVVDANAAAMLSDADLERVLGCAAREQVREAIEDND
jgi:hypothetical protein